VIAGAAPKAHAKRLQGLAKQNADHRETALMLAEDALKREDGVSAWSALSPLVNKDEPTARLCQLAYRAETMLNNPGDARIWLERAAVAPAEADWSDHDPSGDAFDYSDADWRRLVFSFGDNPMTRAWAAKIIRMILRAGWIACWAMINPSAR